MKVLVFFTVGLIASVSAVRRTEASQKQCQSPSLDTSLSREWVNKSVPENGWYFPLMSQSASSDPQEELAHRQIPKRNSEEAFCPRMTWKSGEGALSFFGKTWVIFHCRSNGTFASQACTATDPDAEDAKPEKVNVFFTLTDNKSYILALRCWEDGDQDWGLLTIESKIPAATKEVVLAHIESLGFDREAYAEVSYDKC